MKEGRLNSLLGRRVLIFIAIAVLSALLLAFYYFVYAPLQQSSYNKSAFRVLKNISDNFIQRVEGYDTANRSKTISDQDVDTYIDSSLSKENFDKLTATLTRNDSSYRRTQDRDSLRTDTAQIMEPIVAIRNNLFESIILSKITVEDTATILYKSGSLDIDKTIVTDTLLKTTNGFTFPKIADLTVEGVKYKLFVYPFRIDNQRYFLGGFIDNQGYQVNSNRFPLGYILTIAFLIIVFLLSLPFLKIFLIGSYENISINDVRAIIAMIFITPFIFILFNWTLWIGKAEDKKSEDALETLHKQVKENFYHEIGECLKQLKHYDSLYNDPEGSYSWFAPRLAGLTGENKVRFKDVFLYPTNYKTLDVVFWMNNKGEEVAKWYFQNNNMRYINKSERAYFKIISRNEGFRLPGPDTTTFSIQPTLSLVTGEYTVNIVIHSQVSSNAAKKGNPVFVGLSTKMYSVYKPVVPRGLNFCITNANGDILYHSESDRNLQENIFSEVDRNEPLRLAIANRDSLLVDNLRLYGKDTKLIISPLQGVPYYLVTYCDKRNQYLFTRHIIAFTFLCESVVLLMLSLFVLFFYFANRRFSELFFSPHSLDWIKPSSQKKNYYIIIIGYQVLITVTVILLSFFTGDQLLNYILNVSLLLPFLIVIGYYLLRSAENNAILYREIKKKHALAVVHLLEKKVPTSQVVEMDATAAKNLAACYRDYVITMLKIIIPFVFIMFLFTVLKEDLLERSIIQEDKKVNNILLFLKVYVPVLGVVISILWHRLLITSTADERTHSSKKNSNAYMRYLLGGLMMSITLITILPTFGFLIYANKQELSLQVKSEQMYLAKRLQQHRKLINDATDSSKFSYGNKALKIPEDVTYIKNLKFSPGYGLYLGNDRLTDTASPLRNFNNCRDSSYCKDQDWCREFENYGFYRGITGYLFLPSDHFEYFKNTDDYYWKTCHAKSAPSQSLNLYYSNTSEDRDYRDTSSFILSSQAPGSLPFISKLNGYDKSLQVICLASLLAGLCLLIYYSSKRVFLIGYFEETPGKEQDISFLDKIFNNVPINEQEEEFWQTKRLSLHAVLAKENQYPLGSRQYDECILKIQHLLGPAYEKIWHSCSLTEKSVLYDFALDGFTNYKNVNILYPLYRKGILRKENHHLIMMTDSFRNYLDSKSGSKEISEMERSVSVGGKWGNLSAVFYILLFAIIIFLFIVQEEVSKRILAIVTSLGALIPLLLKLFDSSGSKKTSD